MGSILTTLGKKKTRRSFTLIEMVVAISLLVIMAGALGMQLKGMLAEHTFFSQVAGAKRTLERGVRMAKLLDTDLYVYFDLNNQGLSLELAGISDCATALAGEKSVYSAVDKVLINGEEVSKTEELTFSSRSLEEVVVGFVSKKGKVSNYTVTAHFGGQIKK